MRTLHVGLRVSDPELSLAFYRAVGYTVIGTVEGTPFGSLTGDPFVTIELVHDPAIGTVDLGTGINHLVIQVESLDATLADLAVRGIAADPAADPGHADANSDRKPTEIGATAMVCSAVTRSGSYAYRVE
jgi:lactoylglutathione lyase